MNFRRLVSAVAALAVAGTMCAVPALASTVTTSDDCTSLTSTDASPITWEPNTTATYFQYEVGSWYNVDDVIIIANTNNVASTYSATGTLANATTSDYVEVKVNAYISRPNSGTDTVGNRYNMKWYLADSNGNNVVYLESLWGQLYAIDVTNPPTAVTSGKSLGLSFSIYGSGTHLGRQSYNNSNYSSTGYIDITMGVNFSDHTATISNSQNSTTATVNIPKTVSDISDLTISLGQCYNGVAINSITVTEYTLPKLTIADSDTDLTLTAGDSKTITPTALTGTLSVTSNDTSVATAEVTSDKTGIVITGVDDGSTTVTVTATNDGFTTSQTIAVAVGTQTTTTFTLNYIDSNGNEIADPVLISNVNVGSTLDLTDYIAALTSYTNPTTGVIYSVAYTGDESVKVTENGSYDLVYTLTENTYTATISTGLQYAVVTIDEATSTSGETVAAQTVYTDYSGDASVTAYMGDYTYTVSKNNYSDADGTLSIDGDGATSSVTLEPTIDGLLLWEDFEQTGLDDKTANIFGFTTVNSAYSRLYNNEIDFVGGGGARTLTNTLNGISGYDVYTISYDITANYASGTRTGDNTLSFTGGGNSVAYIDMHYTDSAFDYFSYGATSSSTSSTISDYSLTLSVTAVVDTVNAETTITITDGTNTTSGTYTIAEGITGIDGMTVTLNNSSRLVLDNIMIVGSNTPTITAAVSDTTIGTIAVPTTMTSVTSGDSVDYTDVVGTDDTVTTVYIKIDNTTPTVAPTVTLTDYTEATAASVDYNSVGTSYYYIYQFVNMEDELNGATVTCGNLSTTITISE